MLNFCFVTLLLDWFCNNYSFSIVTIEYPYNGYFRCDSLFAVEFVEHQWYLELFFITIIGEKRLHE